MSLQATRFVALAQELCPTFVLPPIESRTHRWWARVGKNLRDTGLTEQSARDLLGWVAGWSKRPLTVDTLLHKAPDWLALARADQAAHPSGCPFELFAHEAEAEHQATSDPEPDPFPEP